ncbi:MAG: ABC transporter ATP-binding protein [Chitinophagales bacterium]|nr:ABC transporter ATP-binding protein [Chitinophagales bacterium]
MVTLNSINKSYPVGKSNYLHVLKGIDLVIDKGELVSIMGPSGSGKSTLLNILGILDSYDDGEYILEDVVMKNLSEKQSAFYRNKFLGFVFQSFNLLPFKNAMENVALPLYYQKVGRKDRNRIALNYLDKFGLKDWATHMPNELSGGQKQRVAIARAMINKPSVILADEPTGALDSHTSEEVMQIFRDVNKEGTTVIIVTHDREVSGRTDRVISLRDGIIEHSGNAELNKEIA